MGMDLSLGGEVDVGLQEDANHSGPCNDGVFGCSRCFNGANEGKGSIGECDWCKKGNTFLRITLAYDEPVKYAVCEDCRKRQARQLEAEAEEFYSDYLWRE